jgi:hypothetical protein
VRSQAGAKGNPVASGANKGWASSHTDALEVLPAVLGVRVVVEDFHLALTVPVCPEIPEDFHLGRTVRPVRVAVSGGVVVELADETRAVLVDVPRVGQVALVLSGLGCTDSVQLQLG